MNILLFARLFCAVLLISGVTTQTSFAQSTLGQSATEQAALINTDTTPDVRVIIDISGSMKKNDPQNLRRPALELLLQLFPEGSKAGVWTFGQWVNNLVPSKTVDAAWRKRAASQPPKINSVALRTNIPAALETAVEDIDSLDAKYKTHLILLTDGMVDISHSEEVNSRARQKILKEILPKLRQAGVTIHTVALSKNADWELMERLAVETNGLAAVAETAEDLTQIFLQAFDAAAPAEQVPLEGNSFFVDSGIDEFTALIFRKPGTEATLLVSPDEKTHSLAQHSETISWFGQQNYDLITVKAPAVGEWRLVADLQPDSRVTIVSNLSLQVNRLPKSNFLGNESKVAAVLREEGKSVTSPEFLDLVELSVQVNRRDDDQQWDFSLSDFNPTPANGVFASTLDMLNRAGVYDITVLANGKTFQRQQKQTVELRQDFSLGSKATDEALDIYLIAHNPDIDPKTTTVTARVQRPDGAIENVSVAAFSGHKWLVGLAATQSGFYHIHMEASGSYRSGSPFSYSDDIRLEHHVLGSEPPVAQVPVVEPVAEPVIEPEPEPEPKPKPKPVPEPEIVEEGIDWEQIGLYAGLAFGNVLVLVLGFFAYRMVTGGADKSKILDDTIDDDDDDDDDDDEHSSDTELGFEPEAHSEVKSEPEPEPEQLEETVGDETELLDVAEVDVSEGDHDLGEAEPIDDLDDIMDLPDDAIDIDPSSDEKP